MKRWTSFFAAAAVVSGALAQTGDYPSRPVTIVNPWNAGGSIDVIARATGQSMQKQTGQAFIIENVPGAGSMIGTTRAANSKPDGYTLLWGTSSGLVILPQVNTNVKYHPLESFEPISWVGSAPYFVVVPGTSAFKTLAELIAHAKANPTKVTYGSQGTGSSPHVTMEALLNVTQTRMLHIPFKGGQGNMAGLIRGDVDWSMDLAQSVLPLVKSGKLRILATTNSTRLASAPEVPTVAEALKLPSFESVSWIGLFAPKGTSPEQVKVLNKLVAIALQDPDVARVVSSGGFTAAHSTPAELAERVRQEYESWGKVIRSNNIRLE